MGNIEYQGVRCKGCTFADPSFLFTGDVYHCKKFRFEPMSANDFCSKAVAKPKVAHYFETFNGNDYYRDEHGNIYTQISGRVAYCSNLKQGKMTLDKSEPYYEVSDITLIKGDK